MIGCCALFSTLFFIIYNPLDVIDYEINTEIGSLLSTKFLGIIGAAALIFTQFVLRPALKIHTFSPIQLTGWTTVEFLIISIVIFVLYGERGRPFWDELLLTTEKTILLALIPFLLSLLVVIIFDLLHKGKTKTKPESDRYLLLKDENGKKIVTILKEDFLFFKAEDNYVHVAYLKKGERQKILIRTSLKSLVASINQKDILQIHRSYYINKNHINQIIRKSGKTELTLNHVDDSLFAVSSSFKTVLKKL